MKIHSFVFNAFQENTYVLFDDTKACVVVDPGCYEKEEMYELESFIQDHDLEVKLLLNTHCHVDHILGNYFIKEKYKVKFIMHRNEEPVLKAAKVYAPNYGLFQYQEAQPDEFVEEGDEITFGNQTLKVLFTPGHSPGHIVFYHEASQRLIGGDVLFYNSIGRTDLPGGNHNQLISSIHEKLFTLPDAVIVYPGHGPETNIGFEKKTNPFCALATRS